MTTSMHSPPVSVEAVPITIELGSALAPFNRSSEGGLCARCLETDVNVLLDRLGIPGPAIVKLGATRSVRPVRVLAHDRVQAYTPSLMLRAWLAVAPVELRLLPTVAAADAEPQFPAGWLARYAHETAAGKEPDWTVMSAFIERMALHAITKQPSCLLGQAQLAAYRDGLEIPLPDAELAALLEALLDLGVSVADRQLICEIVREGVAIGRPLADTIEAAFTELRPHRVEIHVHPETLVGLLPGSPERGAFRVYAEHVDVSLQRLFRDKEAEFFSTHGFVLPEFVWTPSPGMNKDTIAVKIGEWWGLPVPMVPRGMRLVHAAAEKLRGVEAHRAIHPVTGEQCAEVSDVAQQTLENRGVVTWGPVDFVILVAHADVSRRPGRLLGMEDVEHRLANLSRLSGGSGPTSALVRAILARYTLGDLTRVLRAFVDERLSIRDLAGILERLLEFDTVSVADSELFVVDGRLPVAPGTTPTWREHYAFVRRHLRPYLSHVHTWHDNTVVAYALDPTLEERASRPADGLPQDEVESLRDAVWAHLQGLPPSHAGQVVVTTTRARAQIRALLTPEFPDLPVLARAELGPEVRIQHVGTITTTAGSS